MFWPAMFSGVLMLVLAAGCAGDIKKPPRYNSKASYIDPVADDLQKSGGEAGASADAKPADQDSNVDVAEMATTISVIQQNYVDQTQLDERFRIRGSTSHLRGWLWSVSLR